MTELRNDTGSRQTVHPPAEKKGFSRHLWTAAGTIFLALGAIGIALPIVPTTPFLLLAAACYLKGSRRMYEWMTGNKWFGRYLRDYMEGRGVPMKTKVAALAMLWVAISVSFLFMTDNIIVRVVLLVVAAGVSMHLVFLKTKR